MDELQKLEQERLYEEQRKEAADREERVDVLKRIVSRLSLNLSSAEEAMDDFVVEFDRPSSKRVDPRMLRRLLNTEAIAGSYEFCVYRNTHDDVRAVIAYNEEKRVLTVRLF